MPSVSIQKTGYWDKYDAYRLSNGSAEVVVVPATGRIMEYRLAGGDNVLWPGRDGDWRGDKIWPWPQDDWPAVLGDVWPPAPEFNTLPYDARAVGDKLCIISKASRQHGVRVVRDIWVEPTGSRVHIVSRFESAGDLPRPVAVWSVTQCADAEAVLVKLNSSTEGHRALQKPFSQIQRRGDVLVIKRNDDTDAKIGADGRVFAAVYPQVVFVQRLVEWSPSKPFKPGEQAQIYGSQTFASPADGPPFVELEFTSPLGDPRHEIVHTHVVWQLEPRAGRAIDAIIQELDAAQ